MTIWRTINGRRIPIEVKTKYSLKDKMIIWGVILLIATSTIYTTLESTVVYAHEFERYPTELPTIEDVRHLCASEDVECTWEAQLSPKMPRHEVKIPEVVYGDVEEQIRQIAQEHDFKWPDYLVRLAYCESRLKLNAFNPTNNSDDRGIFQISKLWHPEVNDECAYDLECATEWTMWRINSGYQHEWVCNNLVLK